MTQKKLTNFQAHLIKAQPKIRRHHKVTTKQSGFHVANTVVKDKLKQDNDALIKMKTTV